IGDVAALAGGASKRTVGGGVVVQARDAAALRRTVGRLPALIARSHQARVRMRPHGFDVTSPHAGQAVEVRQTPPGAIATYGAASMRAATAPRGRLGSTTLFRTASAQLGGRPPLPARLRRISTRSGAPAPPDPVSQRPRPRPRPSDSPAPA